MKTQIVISPASQKVLDRLKKAGPLFDQAASAFLKKSALMAEGKARELAPRDKGTLGNSITHNGPHKSAGLFEVKVGTNVEYAPYHEFGTGLFGPKKAPITPKKGKFMRFKSKSGQIIFTKSIKGVRAKQFMKKGIEFVKQNINIAFKEADQIIRRGL